MKKWALILVIFLVQVEIRAQVKQVLRKEFETDEDGTGFTAILGVDGMLIHGRVDLDGPADEWKLTRYDTEFNAIKSSGFAVPDKLYFKECFVKEDQSSVHILFTGKKEMWQLSTYMVKSNTVKTVTGVFPFRFYPNQMKVIGESAFVYGAMKKGEVVLKIDTQTGKTMVIAVDATGAKQDITDMQVMESEKILAVSSVTGDKKARFLVVNLFNDEGDKLGNAIRLEGVTEKRPIQASITIINKDHYILSGTYSSDRDIMANGIYLCEMKSGEQKFIKFYSFSELSKFTDYLSERQKARVEKKAEKKKKQGKSDYLEALVANHPVFEFENNYVFIGEVYYPTYRTEIYTSYVNGKPVRQTRQVFDGYQYTHATIIGINKSGEKLWDFCFPMHVIYKPYYAKRFIRIMKGSEDIKLFYSTGAVLKSFVIRGQKVTERNLGEIENQNEGDRTRWSSNVESEYWYDNYFISYGNQTIKNTEDKNVKRKRKVFFVSKIKFD